MFRVQKCLPYLQQKGRWNPGEACGTQDLPRRQTIAVPALTNTDSTETSIIRQPLCDIGRFCCRSAMHTGVGPIPASASSFMSLRILHLRIHAPEARTAFGALRAPHRCARSAFLHSFALFDRVQHMRPLGLKTSKVGVCVCVHAHQCASVCIRLVVGHQLI